MCLAENSRNGYNKRSKNVAIIGAGPSGLVGLKEYLEAGHKVTVFEKQDGIGGVFSSAKDSVANDNLYLTTSNFFIAYSDFPPLEDKPAYSSKKCYLRYLEAYATHFKLWDHIRLNVSVQEAVLHDDESWRIRVRDDATGVESVSTFDSLVVGGGAFQNPNVPRCLENFNGRVLHSSQFTNATDAEVTGKRVLVVGTGESASDIAAEIAEVAERVVVYTRSSFAMAPRYPLHRVALGENYDEDAMLRNDPRGNVDDNDSNENKKTPTVPSGANAAGALLESLSTNRAGQMLPVSFTGSLPKVRNVIMRTGVRGAAARTEGVLFRSSVMLPNCPQIDTMGSDSMVVTKSGRLPAHFESGVLSIMRAPAVEFGGANGRTAVFKDATVVYNEPVQSSEGARSVEMEDVDVVVACTGYYNTMPWLKVPGVEVPMSARAWYKHCFPPGVAPGKLIFLGYARSHQGGNPATSEMLARYSAMILSGERVLPDCYERMAQIEGETECRYFAGSPHVHNLVDYNSFMDSVGALVGCVPHSPSPLTEPARFVKYWYLANYPCWYRQRGPGADPKVLESFLDRLGLVESFPLDKCFYWILQFVFNMTSIPLLIAGEMLRRLKGQDLYGLSPGWMFLKSKCYVVHNNFRTELDRSSST